MKKITLTMCVCGICLTVMIGCQSKETDIPSVEIVETLGEQGTDDSSESDALPEMKDEAEKENSGENESEEKSFTDLSKEEVPDAEINTSQFTDEMYGDVMEIISAEKTVIVSRLDVDGDVLISPVEGSEELVSVYFTNDAQFILETGKADGSDVNRQEADFSSIQAGDSLKLKGTENTVGTEFLATEVEIIRVID